MNHYRIHFPAAPDLDRDIMASNPRTAMDRALTNFKLRKGQTLAVRIAHMGAHKHTWEVDGWCSTSGCRSVSTKIQEANRSKYRDTRGMDRFYGGKEPPFAVNDEFARTGSIADY